MPSFRVRNTSPLPTPVGPTFDTSYSIDTRRMLITCGSFFVLPEDAGGAVGEVGVVTPDPADVGGPNWSNMEGIVGGAAGAAGVTTAGGVVAGGGVTAML